ncbi:MAG: CsbD family protein [Candidatus Levybacteria bacterium]|nr:CsbD family protein [Candidatus Levybacteria bacterium]
MTDVKAIGQKIRGKVKQVQGDVNQKRRGEHGIKGGLQKISGKLDEVISDAKIKRDQDKNDRR